MGEVYKARDTRLDRIVAVKILAAALAAEPQSRERFEREARAISALDHPHICALYDVGDHAGTAYLVMQYLEGETLESRLKKGPLPLDQAIPYALQIADALDKAHRAGIVHRDLKPGNIMLTASGAKLLDFGLAKASAPAGLATGLSMQATTPANITAQGTIIGTFQYMAPEQVEGQEADARSDIFAFGAVVYEMVTGKKAFEGKSQAGLIHAILGVDPPPMSVVQSLTPLALDQIVRKCLAKDPAARWQTASEIRDQMTSMARQPATSIKRADAQPGRARWLIAGAALMIALAAGAYRYQSRQPIDTLAVLPFVNASGNDEADYLSDGLTDNLISSLSQMPGLKVMSHNAVARYKGKESDARDVAKQLGVRAVLTGRIVQRGNQLQVRAELVDARDNSELWGEQYDRKLADLLTVQQDIAARISQKLRLRLRGEDQKRLAKPSTENAEAYRLYLKGSFFANQFTKDGLEKGLEYIHQAIAADPNYALAYHGLAVYYTVAGDVFLPDHEAMPKAKEAAKKALELDETLSEAHTDLAAVHFWYDYDWPATEKELRRALELNPTNDYAREINGWYLTAIGRFDEGIAEGRKSQEIAPLSAEHGMLTGQNLYLARRYDAAAELLRKNIDLDPGYFLTHYWLGLTLVQQGKPREAIAAFQKARRAEPNADWAPAALAGAYVADGNRVEANKLLNELTEKSKRGWVPACAFALLYAGLDDRPRALAALEKSYDERAWSLTYLKTAPELDKLRREPRFKALLARMNFPQ